jgi:hypothetical protein
MVGYNPKKIEANEHTFKIGVKIFDLEKVILALRAKNILKFIKFQAKL